MLSGVYLPAFNKKRIIKKFKLRKNFQILGSAHNLIEINRKIEQGSTQQQGEVQELLIEDYLRNKIRHSVVPYLKSDDKNVLLKFKTTIENLNSTKLFIEKVISNLKDRIFIHEENTIITNIDLLKDLNPIEFYIHELYKDFEFNYKEILKLFESDSGKHISSPNYKMTKQKNNLIITKIK